MLRSLDPHSGNSGEQQADHTITGPFPWGFLRHHFPMEYILSMHQQLTCSGQAAAQHLVAGNTSTFLLPLEQIPL